MIKLNEMRKLYAVMVKSLLHPVIIYLLVQSLRADGTARWRVWKQIENYGDNLTLICTSNTTSNNLPGAKSMRWYRGNDLCSINDQPTDKTKYQAAVDTKGVKLTILNFTKEDVNRTYQCEIGFYTSKEHMLYEHVVFSRDEKIIIKNNMSEQGEHNFSTIIIIVICVIFAVASMIVLSCCLLRKKKCRGFWKHITCFQRESLGICNNRYTNSASEMKNVYKNSIVGATENQAHSTNGIKSKLRINSTSNDTESNNTIANNVVNEDISLLKLDTS